MEIITRYFEDLSSIQEMQLQSLDRLYRDWNEKINLISRKDVDSLYTKHILHSLAIAAICQFSPGARVLDIGTGGGFPGIPLAIFFPEVEFVMVDSIGKKIRVVQDIIQQTGLTNATALQSRVEDLKMPPFDFAVSRAVAPLASLWKWCKPLLRKGKASDNLQNGLICLKGGDLNEEISQSGLRPHLYPIEKIFPEPFFMEKWVVYVPL